jgi:hypothetical protein
MIRVHRKIRFVAANNEMGPAILFADIGQFKDNAHHPRMNPSIPDTIAKNGVCLLGSATVKIAVRLPFPTPDTVAILKPNIGTDNFMQYFNHLRMID